MSRDERLSELRRILRIASQDYRNMPAGHGPDAVMAALPRHTRRKLEAEAKILSKRYIEILRKLANGGTGYPVDQFIRQMAIDYTNRYFQSGTMNQPASFNYMEPFCKIRLFSGTVAPYAEPENEYNHLFSVSDFFNYITAPNSDTTAFDLRNLPEDGIYHFTQNGKISDFTYLSVQGRQFIISGFSMIRHGASLHWYLVGGEVFSEDDFEKLAAADWDLDSSEAPEHKRRFLAEAAEIRGGKAGRPITLDGMSNTPKTILAGEYDIVAARHLFRCYMKETENAFALFTDDPDIFYYISDIDKKQMMLSSMKSQLDSFSLLWSLAEAFFQLPRYFQVKLTIPDRLVKASGLPRPKTVKGGRGLGARFKHVTSLAVSDVPSHILVSYTPAPIQFETEGYWHRLDPNSFGKGRNGQPVKGRDWIRADMGWRAQPTEVDTVFIKSTLAAAEMAISDYLTAAEQSLDDETGVGNAGVLYVMRCMAMNDEIYKVGWTSKAARARAKELSTTGVPVPFEVVEYWKCDNPAGLEINVHALLDPYRVKANREFFKISYHDLKNLIEQEILRSSRG